ncbi:MauE/DoxX family redox-associated membrane protein [Nocardia goodfellowii]|uniref:Membrane protein YphA (DoxX/SURF4 family) n=1 Tax=Nocardia goodfellowii TaxID=882446 RepID=A0ABS4QT30_9NOCA|nr:MauE/DoxX family redox-associated membrane protein [Nocardia goodfellowii]MBP2194330.1 putative membrane protein YphA (DoxX/SURF4 family) [Nocardia goodfellowii]
MVVISVPAQGLAWTAFELTVRLVVGGLLVARGIGVLRSVETWRQVWLAVHQIAPAGLVRPIAMVLPIAEMVAGILLLLGAFGSRGSVAAGLVLASTTVAIGVARARGLRLADGAFGRLRPLLSPPALLRNAVFVIAIGIVAAQGASPLAVAATWSAWLQAAVVAVITGIAGTAIAVLRRAQRQRFTAVVCA